MQKITSAFFIFLIAFLFLLIAIWNTTPLEHATGITDAAFTTLQKSGETVASNPTTKWLAYLFGLGIISIFGFCLFIGARKKDASLRKKIYRTLAIGIFLYMMVYSLMVFSWWDYAATNNMDYFLGLPQPTAWQMFGLLFIPFFISIFYIGKFNTWIATEEDMVTFNKIVRERRARGIKN